MVLRCLAVGDAEEWVFLAENKTVGSGTETWAGHN